MNIHEYLPTQSQGEYPSIFTETDAIICFCIIARGGYRKAQNSELKRGIDCQLHRLPINSTHQIWHKSEYRNTAKLK